MSTRARGARDPGMVGVFRFCMALGLGSLVLPATALSASVILATTTSTRDSGLLDELLPIFEKESGIEVKAIAVGTGAALRMASRGQADLVLTHSPASERPLVASGDLIEGRRIMHNDFIVLGPPADPAGARRSDLESSLRAIAEHGSFVSRGDDSGTHKRELALWKKAGVDPVAIGAREETGQGMGATLEVANQRRSYTLSDRGTYLALRRRLDLVPIFEGHPDLLNIYSVHLVNPERHRGTKEKAARALAAFFVSPEVQTRIADFRREEFGRPLFVADALPGGAPAR